MGVLRLSPWLWIAGALTACGGGGGSETGPSVVLIVGDTFRADKLSSQGAAAGLTPFLDQMAADGVRFEAARSHAPWTLPSTASILTSLHPLEHGAGGRVPEWRGLSEDVSTVAQRFKEAGYETHAIVNVDFLHPALGVTRDFDTVDHVSFESNVDVRAADTTTDAALEWLDQREDKERPFFLFVHYFDPHCVYAPPELQRKAWALPADRESDWTFGTRAQMASIRAGALVPDEPTLRRAEALYDGEVAYLDAQIGRLDAGLLSRVQADELVTVFTSDHGEEFFDHGGFEHGHTLFDELVRVPLLMRAKGRLPMGVVTEPVRHIDLAPTLCELADLPLDEQYVGRSLVPLARGEAPGWNPGTLAHGNFWARPLTSWTMDGWKLIQREELPPLLFDLGKDPLELTDLSAREPERLGEMQASMEVVLAGLTSLRQGSTEGLTPEMRERLKGFGYGDGPK